MAIGFVLIRTEMNKEREVYAKLLKIKGIMEVHPLFGEYDFIAKVQAKDFNALGRVIINKVRKVKGVTDTKTLTWSWAVKWKEWGSV
jgi:DNA-binding Lrp family transcriptional regulator